MTIQDQHQVTQRCLKGITLLARMVVTSFFLTVFVHFALFSNLTTRLGENPEQAKNHQAHAYYQPVHSATSSGTDLPNTQFLKEGSEEEGKHVLVEGALPNVFYLYQDLTSGAAENLQPHFTRSLQNRPELSLFVLHHSWKSFLI